jgi:hypothetical protein
MRIPAYTHLPHAHRHPPFSGLGLSRNSHAVSVRERKRKWKARHSGTQLESVSPEANKRITKMHYAEMRGASDGIKLGGRILVNSNHL